ncbi:hypothetical protein ACSSS7_007198 [Eimeria intestinalis]
MVRKGGDAAEFVYGLGVSSLEPAEREQDEDDMPLRFVSVQLELPDSSRNFDIDLHGFLFQADGTYVDCVFYKNPALAGKSVRLLQEEKHLLVDLRYVPKRCSYIVCTLAIYSGGTVAQLGNGTVKLAALVPREGVDGSAQFPDLPAGQLPPDSSDSHEWACLGILPLKSRINRGEECGMMLCLLAEHAGFWYFKPVLRAVSAFTPQGLIEPAQEFVTKHLANMSAEPPGVELGALLKAVREGTQVEMDLTDTEGSLGHPDAAQPWTAEGSDGGGWPEGHEGDEQGEERALTSYESSSLLNLLLWLRNLPHSTAKGAPDTVDTHLQRSGEKELPWGGAVRERFDGEDPCEDYRWHKLSPTEGPAVKDFQAAFVEGEDPSAVQIHEFAGRRGGRGIEAVITAKRTRKAPLGFKKKEARGPPARALEGKYSKLKRPDGMRPHGKEVQEEAYEVEWSGPKHARSSADDTHRSCIEPDIFERPERPLNFLISPIFRPAVRQSKGCYAAPVARSRDAGQDRGRRRRKIGDSVSGRSRPLHFARSLKTERGRDKLLDCACKCLCSGDFEAKSLFSSYPSPEKYQGSHRTTGDIHHFFKGVGEEEGRITASWRDSVEKRLAALKGTVDSMQSDIKAIAAAVSDMQRNNMLYVQELRNKLTELKGDVAADIESALAGPLKSLNMRVDKLEANEAADAKQLAEQQRKLWAVDRMVVLAERNSHLIAQSLSELRFQLAGFEQRALCGAPIYRAASPLTDQEKVRYQDEDVFFVVCALTLAHITASPPEPRVASIIAPDWGKDRRATVSGSAVC